ncbi:MAG: hypothetical protein ACI4TW_04615 [Prevotella sp.]
MKTLKVLLATALVMPMLTACLDDDNTASGFSGLGITVPYANSTSGYLTFAALGDWHITQSTGNDWCTISTMQGEGNMIYGLPMTFTQNRTGVARISNFQLIDDNESDVYVNFMVSQYATRGDGTFGEAPLVKTVTGDDGSYIEVTYDENCLPRTLKMAKGASTLHDMTINYSETDSLFSVILDGKKLQGSYNEAFQPTTLLSETDTVGYREQLSLGDFYAFNFEERHAGGEYQAQSLLLTEDWSFAPDREHRADSLSYARRYADGTKYLERLRLEYSDNDNRYQSLDVNQLLLGIDECSPYLLLSLYKYARNSRIISAAVTGDKKYTVETTLNADRSVKTMAVTDKQGNKVTYTFTY